MFGPRTRPKICISSDPNCLMQEGLKASESQPSTKICAHTVGCFAGGPGGFIAPRPGPPFENACTESEGMSAHTFLTRSFLMQQPLSTLWTTSPATRRKLKHKATRQALFVWIYRCYSKEERSLRGSAGPANPPQPSDCGRPANELVLSCVRAPPEI